MPNRPQIAVDMSMLKYPYTGLGQFSLYLGKELLTHHTQYTYDFLLYPSRQDFFPALAYTPQVMHIGKRLLAKNHLPFTLKKYDLWHILSQNSHYFPFRSKSPVLYTIHDLNFLKEDSPAKAERRRKIVQKQVELATQVTAISKFVAEDIASNIDLKGKTIEVVHNGVAIAHYPQASRPDFLPEGLPFIFTVGAVTPRKNFHVLVDMMRFLPTLRLVIAGKPDDAEYVAKINALIAEHRLQERVLLAGAVSDEAKYWLYEHCEAFAFPSLLEGFGMPIIEAFSVGKPVFASALTSLPEVGGELTHYWANFEPAYMARVFEEGRQAIAQDAHFATKAHAHAQRFTWEQAGKRYVSLYEQILKNA